MIDRLTIRNFKSLKQVDLRLGRLNVLIGANASGKSNFFEALRVLQGIGHGFTFSEILNGKPRGASSEVWEGIRGGSSHATFNGNGEGGAVSLKAWHGATNRLMRHKDGSISGPIFEPWKAWNYGISFEPKTGKLVQESLLMNGDSVFDSIHEDTGFTDPAIRVDLPTGKPGRAKRESFERHVAILSQLGASPERCRTEKRSEVVRSVIRVLSDMQRFNPVPEVLRHYSAAHGIDRMGERGENFAALIARILENPATKQAMLSWLQELRPREVDDIGVLKGALGEPMFKLVEGGVERPAPVLSDGTLRFAAIAAALFQPSMPGLLTIEEIENGIHGSRLRLLVELLRSRAGQHGTQIIVTTHSPMVLAWLLPHEFPYTFYCHRDEETGASIIRPLTAIEKFNDVVKRQPLGDLFAEGWLEAAI